MENRMDGWQSRINVCLLLAVLLVFSCFQAASAADAPEVFTFREHILSDDVTVLENNRFRMTIPAGQPYRTDLEQRLLEWMAWVEEASGMPLQPEGFPEKLEITMNGALAYATETGFNLESMDVMQLRDAIHTSLHEMTHVAQLRIANVDCRPFTEGYAVFVSLKAAEAHGPEALAHHLGRHNFTFLEEEDQHVLTVGDMEEFFRDTGDDWSAYMVGFRFCAFLEERFGEDCFADILHAYREAYGWDGGTRSQFVDTLISCTSPDVFPAFQAWYKQNEPRFAATEFMGEPMNAYQFMPVLSENGQLMDPCIALMSEQLTMNFHEANAFAQFSGYTQLAVSGVLTASDRVTLQIYDQHDALLDTLVLEADDPTGISYHNADRLVLTGSEHCTVYFYPNVENCYQK